MKPLMLLRSSSIGLLVLACASQTATLRQKQKLLCDQGEVVQFSPTRVDVAVDTPLGRKKKSYAIATRAIIVDAVQPRDRVNVTYVQQPGGLIVVCLQRIPDIDFDGRSGDGDRGQHLGVSELIVPDAESSRLTAKVGDHVEARPPNWLDDLTGDAGEQKRDRGVVVSIRRLSPVESTLVIRAGSFPKSYVIDLATRIDGRLQKGAYVIVTSEKGADDRRYAISVTPNPAGVR